MKRPFLWVGAGIALTLDLLLLAHVTGMGLRPGPVWVLAAATAVAVVMVGALHRIVRRDHETNAWLSARWQETLDSTHTGLE